MAQLWATFPTFVTAPTARKCLGIMKIGFGNRSVILTPGVRLFNFFLFFPRLMSDPRPGPGSMDTRRADGRSHLSETGHDPPFLDAPAVHPPRHPHNSQGAPPDPPGPGGTRRSHGSGG